MRYPLAPGRYCLTGAPGRIVLASRPPGDPPVTPRHPRKDTAMTRKLTAAVAAAAIAISGMFATPAAALDQDETLRLLLGALAVGVLVKELNDKNKDELRANQVDRRSQHVSSRYRTIPSECVFEVRTRRGWRDVVGKRCVERSSFRGQLPAACAFEVRGERRDRTVYSVNCLRDRGLKVGANRY